MKYIFVFFGLMIMSIADGQKSRQYNHDSIWLDQSEIYESLINMPDSAAKEIGHLPFGDFEFKDVRFDTVCIGVKELNNWFTENNESKKVKVQNGSSKWLTENLNRCYKKLLTPGNRTLVCYIKRLWLTQQDSLNRGKNVNERYNRTRMEIEAYLQQGNTYYPALKIDTLLITLVPGKIAHKIITAMAHFLMANTVAAKAASGDIDKILKRKGYTAEELENRYKLQYNKPILQDKILNKGVYKTFAEFVANNPSITEFKFKKIKKAIILYTKTKDKEWEAENHSFGFCDENILWISTFESFRPLLRHGNTFEFLEPTGYKNYSSGLLAGSGNPLIAIGGGLIASAITSSLDTSTDVSIKQLDMESGEKQ